MEDKTTKSLLDSPLFHYLQTEWFSLEQKVNTVQVQENELLLYVLWVIDAWRDESTSAEMSSMLWDNVRHKLRDRFLLNNYSQSKDDTDTMTAIVCALSISCLGLLLMDSQENRDLYYLIVNKLGEHWNDVRRIKNELHHYDNQFELKKWLSEYYAKDIFYTVPEKLEWNIGVLPISDAKSLALSNKQSMPNVSLTINGPANIQTFNNQSGAVVIDGSTSYQNNDNLELK